MASYSLPDTVKGGSITVQGNSLADAQQAAASATGASLAQQEGGGTFGSNTNADLGGGGGGGGGGSSAPSTSSSPDLSAYVAAMAASSGMSVKQLEEQKREFDATLQQQKDMWQQQGLPQLAIQQRAQDLEEKKFQELQSEAQFTQQLQTRQQDLSQQVQLGQLSVQQAQERLAEFIQTGQLAVSQGQLGLDTLKTAATLSGPENWIQAANFNRGVAANATLPGFVSDLLTGRSTATMGGVAPGAQMSNPLSLQGIAGQQGAPGSVAAVGQAGQSSTAALDPTHMGTFYTAALQAANVNGAAQPATTTASPQATPTDVANAFGRPAPAPTAQQTQTDASADALSKIYAQGGQALGPQQLEGLTPTEMSMFTGGGAAIGADVPGYVRAYQNSRIGQKAAAPALAA